MEGVQSLNPNLGAKLRGHRLGNVALEYLMEEYRNSLRHAPSIKIDLLLLHYAHKQLKLSFSATLLSALSMCVYYPCQFRIASAPRQQTPFCSLQQFWIEPERHRWR